MSRISQLEALKKQRDALNAQIERMEEDNQTLIELTSQIKEDAQEVGISLTELAMALAPNLVEGKKRGKSSGNIASGPKRAQRRLSRYRNPDNGEIIETRGGNHKVLKEWKQKYGNDVVESWRE